MHELKFTDYQMACLQVAVQELPEKARAELIGTINAQLKPRAPEKEQKS